MPHQLTSSEKKELETHYRLLSKLDNKSETISFHMLLDEWFLKAYLEKKKQEIGTDSLFVVGSQFMKRVGFLLAVPILYTWSVYQKCMPVRLDNYFLVSAYKEGYWLPHLFIKEKNVEIRNDENDKEQREKYIGWLFDIIYQLIEKIYKVTDVPRPILWENVAIYIYWLYETEMNDGMSGLEKKRIVDDLNYLVKDVKPRTFHETYNPLARFYTNKHQVEGIGIRVRRTCCFYYETGESENFCSNCPKSKVNKEACLATKKKLQKTSRNS